MAYESIKVIFVLHHHPAKNNTNPRHTSEIRQTTTEPHGKALIIYTVAPSFTPPANSAGTANDTATS